MTVNYTTLLRLVQPVTGTESGTWGDYVNYALTAYLDVAIAGTQTINNDNSNTTLGLTDGTNSGTNLSSTSAQYAILNLVGVRNGVRTVTLPTASRNYVVLNNTSGGYAVGILPGGVTVANGERCIITFDTSTNNYVKIATHSVSNATGTLPVGNGGTGATTLTANNVLLGNGTSAVQVVAPSTSGNVLRSNGTTWQSSDIFVLGTAVNTTSGTTVTLLSTPPTWVKRITLSFANVSTNGSSTMLVQLATAGTGYKTSGYDSGAGQYATTNSALTTTSTSGFVIYTVDPAVDVSGHFVLTKLTGNTWVASFSLMSTYSTGSATTGGGNVTLDGDLYGVRLNTTNGTDTFDAGSVGILYE